MFKFIRLGSEQYLNETSPAKRFIRRLVGHVGLGYAVKLWALSRLLNKYTDQTISNVLDFGCADGMYSFYLKQRFRHSHITGLDGYTGSIKAAKNIIKGLNLKDIKFICCNFDEYIPIKKFNLVTCLDTIHYSDKGMHYLDKACKSTADGGYLVFSCPRLKKYYSKNFEFYTGWVDVERLDGVYSFENVANHIESHGFKILEYVNYPPKLSQKLIEDQRSGRLYIKLLFPLWLIVTWLNSFFNKECAHTTHYMLIARRNMTDSQ